MRALTESIVVAEGPFDSFAGLPLHPLVVHLVVVVLPLAALLLVFVVILSRWRRPFDLIALAGLVIGTVGALLAKQTGEALVSYVGLPQEHADWGTILVYLAAVLVVLAALWVWLERRESTSGRTPLTRAVGFACVLLAVATVIMTALVGHSGAESVWGRTLTAGSAASMPDIPAPAISAPSAVNELTMAEVSRHSTPDDCWTAVNGNAYDLTAWIAEHPGGEQDIVRLCGIDGSQAFDSQHGGQRQPEDELARFLIGPVAG